MLKKGNDHFEVTQQEPKVDVCEKRYVFDAESPGGRPLSFSPAGQCPVYEVSRGASPPRCAEKQQREDDRRSPADPSRHRGGADRAPAPTAACIRCSWPP